MTSALDLALVERRVQYLDAQELLADAMASVLVQADGAREYLYGRGYPGHVLETYRIGWGGVGAPDYLLGRITFPLLDTFGLVRGFAGRLMPGALVSAPKYVNTPEGPYFQKRRYLFGLQPQLPLVRTVAEAAGFMLVCEGYTDVLAFRAAGVLNAVACMGTALTPWQLSLLAAIAPEARLLFDPDAAGRRAADRAVGTHVLEGRRLEVTVAPELPEGVDPGDLATSAEGLALLRKLGGLS